MKTEGLWCWGQAPANDLAKKSCVYSQVKAVIAYLGSRDIEGGEQAAADLAKEACGYDRGT